MKRMYWILFLIVIVIIGVSVWWWRGTHAPMRTADLSIRGHHYAVEIADTIPLRTQGLSDRPSLETNKGMLFIFPSAQGTPFWMKDMHFSLDFVWINGNMVVGTTVNVPSPGPKTSLLSLPLYYPPSSVDKVLEINAGEVAKWGIQAGDTVEIH